MIKILHVISDSNIGGAGHQLLNLIKGLDRNIFEVIVIVPQNAELKNMLDEIGVKHMGAPYLAERSFSIRAIWYLYKIIKELRPDIVHTHAALSARIGARFYTRCKIVNTRHCAFPITGRQKKLRWAVRIAEWFLGGTTVAVSALAKERLMQQGVSEKKIMVVNNGIDTSLYKYDEAIRKETRTELGITEDIFCVGHIGRMEPEKNHAFLLEVFKIVLKQRNSVLVLVGCGTLKKDIQARAKELGIEDNVLFLGTRTDANRLYQCFDVLVMPSSAEGFGLVAVEAQCSGLGCVLSEHFPEVVKLSDYVKFLQLDDFTRWAEETLNLTGQNRNEGQTNVIKSKLDAKTMCEAMTKLYLGIEEEKNA